MFTPGRFLYAYGMFYPDGARRSKRSTSSSSAAPPTELRVREAGLVGQPNPGTRQLLLPRPVRRRSRRLPDYRTMLDLYGARSRRPGRRPTPFRAWSTASPRRSSSPATSSSSTRGRKGQQLPARALLRGRHGGEHLLLVPRGRLRRGQGQEGARLEDAGNSRHAQRPPGGTPRERKMLSAPSSATTAMPSRPTSRSTRLPAPPQTYRITGDPLIRKDIDRTLNMFNRYYRDYDQGGYFSHLDPVTFDPKADRSAATARARTGTRSATTPPRT